MSKVSPIRSQLRARQCASSWVLLLLTVGAVRANSVGSNWDTYHPQPSFYLGPNGVIGPAPGAGTSLARITAYWKGEDGWTTRGESSTGNSLRQGCCAVDPAVIPYGSIVTIQGVGDFVAMDTGSAVVSRRAARRSSAIVVDVFFETREKAKEFLAQGHDYAPISWRIP